jgi:hypothetical protein
MLPLEHAAADITIRRPRNAFRDSDALIAVITVAQSIDAFKALSGSPSCARILKAEMKTESRLRISQLQ